jgi:hypothetical protein
VIALIVIALLAAILWTISAKDTKSGFKTFRATDPKELARGCELMKSEVAMLSIWKCDERKAFRGQRLLLNTI